MMPPRKSAIQQVQAQNLDLLAENRRLARDIENLKDGMFSEDYAGSSWTNRLTRDRSWLLLSGSEMHRVIQKSDVDLYHDLLNYYYHFSPLIRGAIDLKTRYTFGLYYSIQATKEGEDRNKATIEAVLQDPANRVAMFGYKAMAEIDRDLQKGGNVFLAIWPKINPIQVRAWSSYEIQDIVTNPNDADIPLFYIRSWAGADDKQKKKAYPSIFNQDPEKYVDALGSDIEIDTDILVYHVHEGRGLRQKWALSPYTAALPWNRAYEGFLLDFAAIVQMIRKYTTMYTTKGGDAQLTALSTQFNHEMHGHHKNQIGNQLIATEGNDFKVIDAGSNKIVGLSDSRQYLMQFCTAVATPENMLTGNPQTGNRASAQELTANFLPSIEERQTLWGDTFRDIFEVILENRDFEVSFPPIRSQDALTYLDELTRTATLGSSTGTLAGTIQPIDYIKAAYEALDLKLPDGVTLDAMAAALLDKAMQSPDLSAAIDRLTAAATRLQESSIRA